MSGGVRDLARRGWRSRRLRIAGLILAAILVGGPPFLVLTLRWVPPPTTAFMVGDRWRASDDGADRPRYRWTPWDEIAPEAALAVIAAEDQRFPDHHGFDVDAIRDAWSASRRGRRLRGASTISQQTAKNLFLWSGRSYVRKGLEAYFTLLVELCWSKRRILEVYLNVAQFGDGVYGVAAASTHFFGKRPADLEAADAARLAAVLPNPIVLRVDRPSAYVREREAWIRGQMRQLGGADLVRALAAR